MTQSQLERAVAGSTGESLTTIHHLGFGPLPSCSNDDLEPEDLRLVLDCPFCGHPVPYPGRTGSGALILAECDHCDIYFDVDPGEVYPAAVTLGEPLPADAA